jgi:hypothetical protein
MPYKANADRRHKIPKARYRVTNWPEYDAALVRRGSLTFWVTEEALAAWHAPVTGRRGRSGRLFPCGDRNRAGASSGFSLAASPDRRAQQDDPLRHADLRSYQMKHGAEGKCNPTDLHAPS